jgi:hypothetical protein
MSTHSSRGRFPKSAIDADQLPDSRLFGAGLTLLQISRIPLDIIGIEIKPIDEIFK